MIINKLKTLSIIEIFTFYVMEDASSDEVRLTFYLLNILTYSPQGRNFVFRDDMLKGYESFDNNGKRIFATLGTGIKEKNLDTAIEKLNERGLLSLETKDSITYIVKLNFSFFKNAEIPLSFFS